jgi:hypothetical protein
MERGEGERGREVREKGEEGEMIVPGRREDRSSHATRVGSNQKVNT